MKHTASENHAPPEAGESPIPTRHPSFVTPEMIEKNPLLKHAGVFAGDPLWDEVIAEIKRNRKPLRQRGRREAVK